MDTRTFGYECYGMQINPERSRQAQSQALVDFFDLWSGLTAHALNISPRLL